MYVVKFEEALSMTGFGRYNYIMQFLNIILIMGTTFETVSVAYLVPASACELNTTNFQQGLIAGIPLFGMTLTSHFGGYFADTRGRRVTLIWCMSLSFVLGALSSLSPNWICLGVFKLLSSCAVAGSFGLAITFLSESTPVERRATVIALTSAIFIGWIGVMAVLCVPVLQLKFDYYIPYLDINFTAWRLLTILYATPCALGAVGVYFSNESPRYLLIVGKEKKAIQVLKRIYSINNGKSGDDFNVNSLELGEDAGTPITGLWLSMVSQTVPLLKPPLLKDTVVLSIIYFISFFGLYPFLTWLPYTADSVVKSLENGIANLSLCDMLSSVNTDSLSKKSQDCSFNSYAMDTVFAICCVIATLNVVLSAIVNYVRKKWLLISVQLFSGAAGICINFASSWALGVTLLIMFTAGVVNFGFLSMFSIEVFPTYVKAMGVVLTLMVGRIASLLGINILKYLLVNNCELAFYSYGGLIFVGGLIALMLSGDAKATKKKLHYNEIVY